jgi:hypothetical protein
MARLPTYEELLDNNRGVPIEESPLELRVRALEQKVEMLMAARVREAGKKG